MNIRLEDEDASAAAQSQKQLLQTLLIDLMFQSPRFP
jgi:hypothetical protein